MTRAMYNSPNQLYKSLNIPISFSEFLQRMKARYGENFFEDYQRRELSYEEIQGISAEKVTSPILKRGEETFTKEEVTTKSSATSKFTTILLIGALAYVGYAIYKKRKG